MSASIPKHSTLSSVLMAVVGLYTGSVCAQTYSKTEVLTYHDNTTKWVLGQSASVTCVLSVPASDGCNGDVVSSATFDPTTALPLTVSSFSKLQSTMTYHADGNLATIKDGLNKTTSFTNWKRGVPQTMTFADSTSISAIVDDNGWITKVTDEYGYQTCRGYDAMGRLIRVEYPNESTGACDSSEANWKKLVRSFVPVALAEYGIPAGHWRETVTTGNATKITYYDAMWRPLLVRAYDAIDEANTKSFIRTSYDNDGRVVFQSYPSDVSSPTTGIWTTYDALGRVTSVGQDTELTPISLQLTTKTYGTGFTTTVTNPRGFSTSSTYLTYDQPSTEWPLVITAPDGSITSIDRDPHGKPALLTRSGSSVAPVVRSYAYDFNQQLCRSQEPETGATLYTFDAAGNLTASAAGLPIGTNCGTANTRTVNRGYDARNRLTTLSFPDGNNNQTWTYTLDGLPSTVNTNTVISGVNHTVTNGYVYNKRRLMSGESMKPDTIQLGWGMGYGYNNLGQVVSEAYPASVTVNYTVNALGQTKQVTASSDGGAATTIASAASYFPNGALKQFTYGNGIVHTMNQNARQLPSQSVDGTVLNLTTTFDPNGNVSAITDGTAAARQTRSMVYDQLDRLTSTTSPMFGTASYVYDELDNLKQVNVSGGTGARNHYYCYNAANQLAFVRSGSNCSSSPAVVNISYDLQGNLLQKTGTTGGTYTFDYGNRLRTVVGPSAPTLTYNYRYDADGRRVRHDVAGNSLKYSYYAKDGRVVWQRDEPNAKRISNIYLAGSLVAEYGRPIGSNVVTVSYQHTDALGSPIAKTNSSGTVIKTSEYEPYGDLLNEANDDRVGYTGHVMDAASGLTYMQQRYYDPQIGLFLSNDPVTAYGGDSRYFNRYWYAAGNPYKYTDPDGRVLDTIADIAFIGYSSYKLATQPSWTNAAALGLDIAGAAIPFVTGLGQTYRAANALTEVARAAEKTAVRTGNAANDGTRIHTQFDRALNNGAVRNVRGETAYRNGQQVSGYRPKGSSNPDAVLGNPSKPIATFDLKTGASGISKAQADKAARNLPYGTPLIEIRSTGHNVPRPQSMSGAGTGGSLVCDQTKSCK